MRVHDSQTYRKVDVTRERISRISELGPLDGLKQTDLKCKALFHFDTQSDEPITYYGKTVKGTNEIEHPLN